MFDNLAHECGQCLVVQHVIADIAGAVGRGRVMYPGVVMTIAGAAAKNA